MSSVAQSIPSAPYNPYLVDESSNLGANAAGYFPNQSNYATPTQPLQYHLYAPVGPHKEDLAPYQRLVHDFFLPETLREELQKKSEASQQVMHGNFSSIPTSSIANDFRCESPYPRRLPYTSSS